MTTPPSRTLTTPPSRTLTTLGVLLGAVGGAAAASALYGVISVQWVGSALFPSRVSILFVGITMIPLFTFAGAAAGGLLVRQIVRGRTDGPSSPAS